MRLLVSKTKTTLTALALIAGTAVAAEPGGEVVLNRNTYVRVWTEFGLMRLNSEVLKADGDELFGKATATDLTGERGARIPSGALAVQYMVGHNLGELPPLGQERSDPSALTPGQICWASLLALTRYSDGVNLFGPPRTPGGRVSDEDRRSYIRSFMFFDHITAAPPQTVPAKACQPIWLSLRIPADAPAGKYKGAITVQADGVAPVTVPMETEVLGWRVPSPTECQMFVQSEQSPYGVAKAYKVGLWSDRHWQLIESSFRQLAHIGNRWLFVPVLMNSELGNREDTMIRWIRKKDGTLAFDYALLDRYLATAQRIQGRPKAICFDIMQAVPAPTEVKIFDESAGKDVVTPVGPDQEGTRRPLWQQFGKSLLRATGHSRVRRVLHWEAGSPSNMPATAGPANVPALSHADGTPLHWTRVRPCQGHSWADLRMRCPRSRRAAGRARRGISVRRFFQTRNTMCSKHLGDALKPRVAGFGLAEAAHSAEPPLFPTSSSTARPAATQAPRAQALPRRTRLRPHRGRRGGMSGRHPLPIRG